MSELLKAVTVHPSWRKNEDFFKSMEDSLLKIEEEHFPNDFHIRIFGVSLQRI